MASSALAEPWPAPEESEIFSENGAYVFRVVPKPESDKPRLYGNCQGMLYAKNGDERSLQWGRPLVNNLCPIRACVSNSGKYVVTLGEWGHYDKLPIVMYWRRGDVINLYGDLRQIGFYDFKLETLRAGDGTIPLFESGRWDWPSHSLMFFTADDDFFVLRLANGEVLVFETFFGGPMYVARYVAVWKEVNSKMRPDKVKKYEELKKGLARLIVLQALRLASSERHRERDDGLFVLNQLRDGESIRALQEAMNDPTTRIVDTPQGKMCAYPIRKAAREALKVMGEKVPEDAVLEEKLKTEEGQ